MKYLKKISPVVLALTIAACNNQPSSEYKTAESGLMYRFYTQNEEAVKPREGEYVKVILTYRNNKDSILFDSKQISRDASGAIEFPLGPPTFKGSFEEALTMMSMGDSASFKINADSLFMKTFNAPQPPSVEKGSLLTFEAKLIDIKTKDQVMKEEAEARKNMLEIEQQKIAKYIADNNITVTPTASGLYFIELAKGKGERIVAGKTVQVNYKGMFLNGEMFDTSEGRAPFEFIVGAHQVIPGWDEALQMMAVGSKVTLIIPSSIAYGSNGAGQAIPPYTPLVFEIEVISVK